MFSSTPLKERLKKKFNSSRQKWTLSHFGHKLLSFIPIVSWLPNYDWSHSFFGDLSGGLTMAVFSVPQGPYLRIPEWKFSGIALAGITGVSPVYGLYTAIFPSFLYIFFGTSKHNALGWRAGHKKMLTHRWFCSTFFDDSHGNRKCHQQQQDKPIFEPIHDWWYVHTWQQYLHQVILLTWKILFSVEQI